MGGIHAHGMRLETCPVFEDEFELNNKFLL